MNIVVLKALLLGVMAATTVLFGVIPLKVIVFQILSRKSGKFEQRASFTISLLSCFAGGVFLAVCFLDILPEAYESYESWKTAAKYKSEYPFVPLMFTIGFFLVRLLEEIVDRFCGHEEYAWVIFTHLNMDDTTVSVASLFFGIIVHKAVVSFSVGMRLAEAHTHRRWLVVALICAFAIVAPIGGAVGIVLQVREVILKNRYTFTTYKYITHFCCW
ncbi:unnamed protein product [Haemonchus placei]|uniref:Na_H_Exchanger domain-containing protein n=1 Tax=Haemonchus placei TaxID=6290 RepID=A0A0N4WQM3_HAEPC|nr:unnamed protein product [Haemonchus placei]